MPPNADTPVDLPEVQDRVQTAMHADERGYPPDCYSSLSATIGSTRVARTAGTRQAVAATVMMSATTPASVAGSLGRTPKRSVSINRVSTSAEASRRENRVTSSASAAILEHAR